MVLLPAGLLTSCAVPTGQATIPVAWVELLTGESGVADVRLSIADDNSTKASVRPAPPVSRAWRAAARSGVAAAFLAEGTDPRGAAVEITTTPGTVPDAALAVATQSALTGNGVTQDTTVIASVLPNGALIPGLAPTGARLPLPRQGSHHSSLPPEPPIRHLGRSRQRP